MRRKRFINNKKYTLFRNIFILAFILVCIFIGTGYSLLTAQIEIEGKATMLAEENKSNNEISNSIANLSWKNLDARNVTLEFKIKNLDEKICNWNIKFEVSDIPSIVEMSELDENFLITTSENTITIKETGNDMISNWDYNEEKNIKIKMVFPNKISQISINNLSFNGRNIKNVNKNKYTVIDSNESNKKQNDEQNNTSAENNNVSKANNNVSAENNSSGKANNSVSAENNSSSKANNNVTTEKSSVNNASDNVSTSNNNVNNIKSNTSNENKKATNNTDEKIN